MTLVTFVDKLLKRFSLGVCKAKTSTFIWSGQCENIVPIKVCVDVYFKIQPGPLICS